MIEAQLADGTILQFPAGTAQSVVDSTVKAHLSAARPAASGLGKTFDAATDTLLQGATLGFADEVGAAGSAVGQMLRNLTLGENKPMGQAYDDALAAKRKQLSGFRDKYPVTATLLEAGGGLVGAVPRAIAGSVRLVAPKMMTQGANIARGAGTAGAAGTVAGFGSGEGDAGQRTLNAAQSGVISGAAGAALPLVANVAAGVGGTALNLLGLRNADKAATNQLMRAFERDGISLDDAMARLRNWKLQGAKPEMLIDLGGENVRGLARSAAGVPGEAKQRAVTELGKRQDGQAGRIADDVSTAVSPDRDYYATFQGLADKRRVDAAPLYETAYAKEGVWSDELANLMQRPAGAAAWQKARTIAANEGHDLPKAFKLDGDGNIIGVETLPDMRAIDYIKRGLDDVVQDAKDPLTGKIKTDSGRAVDSLRRDFLRKVDALNPDYAKARASFAGDTASMEAMTLGRGIFKEESEITAKEVAALSAGDKDFFRAGVVRAIKEVSDKTKDGADVVKRLFGSPDLRQKLAAAFDDPKQFMAFEQAMKREGDMYRNAQNVSPRSGSQTDLRAAERADMELDPAGSFIETLAQNGNITRAAANAYVAPLFRRGQGINSSTADALTSRMFNPDYAATENVLSGLAGARTSRLLDLERKKALGRSILLGGGTAIGVQSD